MKHAAAIVALALGLGAGAAYAQEPGEDAVREGRGAAPGSERADRPDRVDRPERSGRYERRDRVDRADRPPAPPPAPEPPRAAEARSPDGQGRFYGPGGRGGYERRDGGDRGRDDRDRSDRDRAGRDRGDRTDRDRDRDRDWRRDDDRRRWDHDRRDDRRHWAWGRWPGVYSSPYRYRYDWRPPVGFYARDWVFGEHLPRGWYGSGWWIDDPWAFRLPLPPPGYGWVRSGDDALLIDRYNGRIVQVVRDVFW